VGKPEGNRPLGRPCHRWDNDIKMDLQDSFSKRTLLHGISKCCFKQTLDRINRDYISEAMKEFGIPNKLINLTKMTPSNTLNKVKMQKKLSDNFLHSMASDKGIPYLSYY